MHAWLDHAIKQQVDVSSPPSPGYDFTIVAREQLHAEVTEAG